MSLKSLPIYLFISLLAVFTPAQAFAADPNVGNEVVDSANGTLTRTGSGTAVDPYKLQLNLGNANTWTANQTFNAALTATGTLNLGDGGDSASLSGTSVTVNAGDNNATAFLVQQGTIKYLQVETTDGSENIAFGNTTTNPSFSFLGNGVTTFSGNVGVNGGNLTTNASTANLFNTSATTVNIAGAATSLSLGATTGTTTIRNSTISFPNATALNATSAAVSINSASIGGGYGSTGVTVSNSGNILSNGNVTVDGTSTLTGNVTVGGDVAVNGGDLTTTNSTASLFNTNATTLNIGGAATTINIGGFSGSTIVNNNFITNSNFTANGDIAAQGASNFNPASTNSVTINTDSDSFLVLNGLQTNTGDALCIDASNNVVKCSAGLQAQAKSTSNDQSTATLVEQQQKEIDELKAEVEALKASINK
jgi:hypothetical protein